MYWNHSLWPLIHTYSKSCIKLPCGRGGELIREVVFIRNSWGEGLYRFKKIHINFPTFTITPTVKTEQEISYVSAMSYSTQIKEQVELEIMSLKGVMSLTLAGDGK